jgi:hypothetical protein
MLTCARNSALSIEDTYDCESPSLARQGRRHMIIGTETGQIRIMDTKIADKGIVGDLRGWVRPCGEVIQVWP